MAMGPLRVTATFNTLDILSGLFRCIQRARMHTPPTSVYIQSLGSCSLFAIGMRWYVNISGGLSLIARMEDVHVQALTVATFTRSP